MNHLMTYGFELITGVCFGFWKGSAFAGITVYSALMCQEFDITTRQFIFLCFVGSIAGLLGIIFLWLEKNRGLDKVPFKQKEQND